MMRPDEQRRRKHFALLVLFSRRESRTVTRCQSSSWPKGTRGSYSQQHASSGLKNALEKAHKLFWCSAYNETVRWHEMVQIINHLGHLCSQVDVSQAK